MRTICRWRRRSCVRRASKGNTAQIAAHALLESYSVSLHINPLTCVSKSAVFLCNLTKNLTSQSAHPNLCGVALTTESAGGEPKQSGGLFWRGEPSPGVSRCEAQIPQFSVKSANKKSSPKAKKQEKFLANKKMYNKTAGEQIVHQQMQLKSLLI